MTLPNATKITKDLKKFDNFSREAEIAFITEEPNVILFHC